MRLASGELIFKLNHPKLVLQKTIELWQVTMTGKIRRKLVQLELAKLPVLVVAEGLEVCPLCGRETPTNEHDAHHLIPKSKGGRKTEFLHSICHRQIQALLAEKDLASNYRNIEQLLTHPEIEKFVFWIKYKPKHFNERTYKSQ